jgi:pimeloyl-ACP methyl ester carboxylesterase
MAGNVRLNYDTFGDRKNPAILLIMGLASQKVRYPSDFCQRLADCGFFVVRYDNRDVGRSSRVFDEDTAAGRLRSVRGLPEMLLFKLLVERSRVLLVAYALLGAAAWRRGQRRYRLLHMLWGILALGFVKTYRPKAQYTIEDMARDAVCLLDSLGIMQAHLVGYSMGGMIAQTVARSQPKRCSSLILMSTCSPCAQLLISPGLYFFLRLGLEAELAFCPWVSDEMRTRGIARLWSYISGPNQVEAQGRLASEEQTRGHQDADAAMRQIMAIMAFTRGQKPEPTARVESRLRPLVIHGQLDPILPLCHGMELARLMRCKCVVLHDIGHDILPGGQREVLEAIETHLQMSAPMPKKDRTQSDPALSKADPELLCTD